MGLPRLSLPTPLSCRARCSKRLPGPPFTSTNRHYRGQTLRVLGALGAGEGIALDALGPQVKPGYTAAERPWLYALVAQLGRDGLVRMWTNAERGPGTRSRMESAQRHNASAAARHPAGDSEPRAVASVRERQPTYDAGDPAGAPESAPELDLTTVRVSLPEA